jgi:Flp pilus assembly protein TadG
MSTMTGVRPTWQRRETPVFEFAVIGPLLVALLLGIVSIGLLIWSMRGVQSLANATARCGAIASKECADAALTRNFAMTNAGRWVSPAISSVSDVAAAPEFTTCDGATGWFYKVTIRSSFFAVRLLPSPWKTMTFHVSACDPVAPPDTR